MMCPKTKYLPGWDKRDNGGHGWVLEAVIRGEGMSHTRRACLFCGITEKAYEALQRLRDN